MCKLHEAAKELAEALQELLFRFELVCQDVDGNTDPADKKRMKIAKEALRRAGY